jgi:inorganic pyrophosphatase
MEYFNIIFIYVCVLIALFWAFLNSREISKISVEGVIQSTDFNEAEDDSLFGNDKIEMIRLIGNRISKGANAFLIQEYSIMLIFIVIFAIFVLLIVDIFGQETTGFRMYATTAFIIGSLTSILCGWIGMSIAVKSNYRTTFMAL